MKLAMNPREAVFAAVVGIAIATAAPPLAAGLKLGWSSLRPWMHVSEIKVTLIEGLPHVTAHREVRRLVVGGRYAAEVFELTGSTPHQVCTGTGSATYAPDEPELIGPMDLDRYIGGRRGEARSCIPALRAGHEYALTTVWCTSGSGDCDGQIVGPRVLFRMPDDWVPPALGDRIR